MRWNQSLDKGLRREWKLFEDRLSGGSSFLLFPEGEQRWLSLGIGPFPKYAAESSTVSKWYACTLFMTTIITFDTVKHEENLALSRQFHLG